LTGLRQCSRVKEKGSNVRRWERGIINEERNGFHKTKKLSKISETMGGGVPLLECVARATRVHPRKRIKATMYFQDRTSSLNY